MENLRKPRIIKERRALCLLGFQQKNTLAKSQGTELGYKDSNLEMTESESVALPFGDTPMFHNERYYIIDIFKMQALFFD